jgi:quinol monooxygenase YgiN
MIVLAVVWQAKEGHESEVAGLFRKLEAASREEPGCLMYVVHRHLKDPRRFFIYEQYHDDAALDAHRNALHFQRYAVQDLPNIATRVEGELYEPLNRV